MDFLSLLKRPSAFLPIAASLLALAIIGAFLATHGPEPQADEGTAAHLWQFLMMAQVPVTLFFGFRWVPRAPRQGIQVLALQITAAVAAAAPVFLLRW